MDGPRTVSELSCCCFTDVTVFFFSFCVAIVIVCEGGPGSQFVSECQRIRRPKRRGKFLPVHVHILMHASFIDSRARKTYLEKI